MGDRKKYAGVELHYGQIRISFHYCGKRCRETLPAYKPTPAGEKQASRIREEIQDKIKNGTFRYADYFPDSKNVRLDPGGGDITLREVAEAYLRDDPTKATSTLIGYRKSLEAHILPELGDDPIRLINYARLAEVVNGRPWRNAKTRNNCLTPLRGIFDYAVNLKYIDENPANLLKFGKVQKRPPDPLTLDEVNKVLARMADKMPGEIRNYFEFAIFTGLRTSELLALRWGDVDFNEGFVRIERAKVRQEEKAATKSYRVRDVELNSRALAALQRQKPLSMMRGDRVFINPVTGTSFYDDKVPREHWTRALLGCGIRYRVAYQTRHTFATLNLMAGANPMWVSRQLGHKNMKLTLEVYSRWIDGADRRREVDKLEALLNG